MLGHRGEFWVRAGGVCRALRRNRNIAAPSDRGVRRAGIHVNAQPHETSDLRRVLAPAPAGGRPRPGGGMRPPRRRDARRGLSSLKSSHKKKTHAPCDAAARGGGSTVPAHAPQHTG